MVNLSCDQRHYLQDPSVTTDVAIAALNGLKMGDKTLSVRRASAR
jgi:splicing factor U2AF subunit